MPLCCLVAVKHEHFPCFSTDIRQIKWIHQRKCTFFFVFYLLCCIWRYIFALILSFVPIKHGLDLVATVPTSYRGVSVFPLQRLIWLTRSSWPWQQQRSSSATGRGREEMKPRGRPEAREPRHDEKEQYCAPRIHSTDWNPGYFNRLFPPSPSRPPLSTTVRRCFPSLRALRSARSRTAGDGSAV